MNKWVGGYVGWCWMSPDQHQCIINQERLWLLLQHISVKRISQKLEATTTKAEYCQIQADRKSHGNNVDIYDLSCFKLEKENALKESILIRL